MHMTMAKRKQAPLTLRNDARLTLEVCAGWNSRLAARRIAQFLEKRMESTGLSLAQFSLMAQVAAAPDDTIGAIADRMELDQSTLSRNLQALARDGLVEIATVEGDLRRRAVWLTETGARKLESAMPKWRAAHEELSELVGPKLVRDLARASHRLVE